MAKTTQKHWWKELDKKLDFVDPSLLDLEKSNDFSSYLISNFAPSSLKSLWRTCLNPSVNQAVEKGLVKNNPYKKIELPKVTKTAIECFDSDEIKAIIAAFYSDKYCPDKSAYKHNYYAPMVEFLSLTGCPVQ